LITTAIDMKIKRQSNKHLFLFLLGVVFEVGCGGWCSVWLMTEDSFIIKNTRSNKIIITTQYYFLCTNKKNTSKYVVIRRESLFKKKRVSST
jgi:hypothetical protein